MLLLFSLQAFMFSAALLLLAAPFIITKQNLLSRNYLLPTLFILLLSSLLYGLSRDRQGLTTWLAGGKEHYHLMETFSELGGIDGAINSLQHHLVQNGNDAKAWFLLGKLYLTKQDLARAQFAFSKAHELKPEDAEITRFYASRP